MINIFGFIYVDFNIANITFSQIILLFRTTNYKFNNDEVRFLFLPQSTRSFLSCSNLENTKFAKLV
ncbi:hypothetical protein AR687_02740 [Flavobacteriaceae bacterium CRH]|nr:hypothetical protein AR687_02740 [Flavobacteriaceae bacterium CRH]